MKKIDASRRIFAQSLAGLAAAPLLAPGRPAAAPPVAAAPSGGAQGPSALALALTEVVKTRYGAQINPADLPSVTQSVEGDLRAAARLAQFKLANGDEPSFVFTPETEQ
jgi:hypothetical protein